MLMAVAPQNGIKQLDEIDTANIERDGAIRILKRADQQPG